MKTQYILKSLFQNHKMKPNNKTTGHSDHREEEVFRCVEIQTRRGVSVVPEPELALTEELQITVTPLTSQNNLPGMPDNALLMQGSNSVSH